MPKVTVAPMSHCYLGKHMPGHKRSFHVAETGALGWDLGNLSSTYSQPFALKPYFLPFLLFSNRDDTCPLTQDGLENLMQEELQKCSGDAYQGV